MVVLMVLMLYSKAEIVCFYTGNVFLLYQKAYIYNRPHLGTALSGREAVMGIVIGLQYFIYECCHCIESAISNKRPNLSTTEIFI